MQRTSPLLLLLGAVALARAESVTTTTGIDPEYTSDTIFDRLLDDTWNSRLSSAFSEADSFTTLSAYAAYESDFQAWASSTWLPTQTVVPTTVRPPSNTGDPDPTDEEEAEMMEGSAQMFRGMAEVAEGKEYFKEKGKQEEFERALRVQAETVEDATKELRKVLGMDEKKEEEGEEKKEKKEEEEKDGDESSAVSTGVNVRALGAVLAAGFVAVLAL